MSGLLNDQRKKAGLTLVQAARIVGIDAGHLSRIERGATMSLEVARKLAGLYEVTVDDVTGGAIPPEPNEAA